MVADIKGLKAYLLFHDYVEIKAVGTSMLPSIREGDCIKIEKTQFPKVGDVVVFSFEEQLIMHRIIKEIADLVWCKGDNSLRIEVIPRGDIVGVVKEINSREIPMVSVKFLQASTQIGKLFIRYKYDREKLLQSREYLEYHKEYLE